MGWTKKLFKSLLIGICVLVFALYLILPAGMGIAAVFPQKEEVGQPPAGFDEQVLSTDDHETLAAWYHAGQNGAALILIHGAGGSREGMRPYAEMLARRGYGVLALDLRGHGKSTGKTNRLGWSSTPDVGAGVRFLQDRGVSKIGALGVSMGGEVVLGAASRYPALQAIATDGATRRCTEELLALPSERSLVRNFTARVMYATVGLLSGETPPYPLLESMREAKNTRFFWIAAGNQKLEIQFGQLFAQTLAERGELWIVDNVSHIGAFSHDPAEYEKRLTAFYEAALGVRSVP